MTSGLLIGPADRLVGGTVKHWFSRGNTLGLLLIALGVTAACAQKLPLQVGPDSPLVELKAGATLSQKSIEVRRFSLQPSELRVTFRNTGSRSATLHLVPRFFDRAGREIVHAYQARTVEVAPSAERELVVSTPDASAARAGLTEAAARAASPRIQTTRLRLTRTQYESMRVHAWAGLFPIGFGATGDPLPKGIGWYEPKTGALVHAVEVRIELAAESYQSGLSSLSKGSGATPEMLWLNVPVDPAAALKGIWVEGTTAAGKKFVVPARPLVSGLSALVLADVQALPPGCTIETAVIDGSKQPITFDPAGHLRTPAVDVVTTPGTTLSPGTATFTHKGGPPAAVQAYTPDGTFVGPGTDRLEFVLNPGQVHTERVRAKAAGQPIANVGWAARAIEESGLIQPFGEGPILTGSLNANGQFTANPGETIECVDTPPTLEGVPAPGAVRRSGAGGTALYTLPLAGLATTLFRQRPRVNDTSYGVVPTQVDPAVTQDLFKPDEQNVYAINAQQVDVLNVFFDVAVPGGGRGGGAFPVGDVRADRKELDPDKVAVDKWDWEIDWEHVQGRDGWTFHNFSDWGPLGSVPSHYYAVFNTPKDNTATGECDEVWGFDKKSVKNCKQEFSFETETRGAMWWEHTITVVYIVKICDIDWCKWKLCKYKSNRGWPASYKWVIASKECSTVKLTTAKKKIAEYPMGTKIDWADLAKQLGGGE